MTPSRSRATGLNYVEMPPRAPRWAQCDGVHWSGTADPGDPAPGRLDHSAASARRRLPADLSLLGVGPSPASATTRSRTSTCRLLLRRRGVRDRRRVERLPRDRRRRQRRHRLHPAALPDVAAEQRARPLWTDLNPPAPARSGRRLSGGPDAHTWVVVDWAGVKNFGNATTHSFEAWLQIAGSAGPAPRARRSLLVRADTLPRRRPGPRQRRSAIPTPASTGARNPDGSSGVNIASRPPTAPNTRQHAGPDRRWGTQNVRFYDASLSTKAGTYKSVAEMTSDVTPVTPRSSSRSTSRADPGPDRAVRQEAKESPDRAAPSFLEASF